MAPSSAELLERAWQQLELENPESVDKLRLLKTEQGRGDGQELKTGSQQPQLLSPYWHAKQVFMVLTAPQFASNFGDVTLVFQDGEQVRFYRSILSLISDEWRLLLQVCNNSDLVILTGHSRKEFFEDVLDTEQIVSSNCDEEVHNANNANILSEGELEDKDVFQDAFNILEVRGGIFSEGEKTYQTDPPSNQIKLYSRDVQEVELPSARYGSKKCPECGKSRVNLAKHMKIKHSSHGSTDKRGATTCTECGYVSTWSNLSRHKRTKHGTKKFQCNTCGEKFYRSDTLKKHMCRKDLSIFPIGCNKEVPCNKRFKSLSFERNHRRSARCQSFFCQRCHKTFRDKKEMYKHDSNCLIWLGLD